jgi:ESS family glutamate:Na+ symporter
MYGIEKMSLGKFGTNTIKPMIWGFNFLIGSLIGVLVKVSIRKLQERKLMTRDYTNDYLLNRISGFMFDLMIVAGVAAIRIEVLENLIVPLTLICLAGTIITYYYVRAYCYYLFPEYKEAAFVSMFGMLTGTNSTGMILLREVDPQFETPAANNLIYQSFWAIAFGLPLFLLLGFAPKGIYQTIISLVVIVIMFIAFNIILLRRKIFKKQK